MKKISFVLVCLLLLCIFPLTSCNKYDSKYVYDGTSLIGKWREESFDENNYKIYEFGDDGKASYRFYVCGIENKSYSVTLDYKITDNNKITLIGDNYFFEGFFSIKDKEAVMSDGKNDISVLEKYDLTYNDTQKDILGSWKCTDDGVVWNVSFSDDGNGENTTSGGKIKMLYSTKGNELYMIPIVDENSPLVTSAQLIRLTFETDGETMKITTVSGSVINLERE